MKCLHFDEVDSTQKWCLRNLENLRSVHGLSPSTWVAVSASYQTAGVGTRDSASLQEKKWISPPNNVSVTYVIPWPTALASRLLNFAQTASVAVCKVLEKYGLRGQIKWINDVFVNDRKICGVLCHNPAFLLQSSPPPAAATPVSATAAASSFSSSPLSSSISVSSSVSSPFAQSAGSPPSQYAQYEQPAGERFWAVLVGVGINVEKKPGLSEMGIKQAATSIAEELDIERGGGPRHRGTADALLKKTTRGPSSLFAESCGQETVGLSSPHSKTSVNEGGVRSRQMGYDTSAERQGETEEGKATPVPCGDSSSTSSAKPSSSGLDLHEIRASLDAYMYESFSILQREGFKALRPFVLSRLAWLGDYVELEEEGQPPSAASGTPDSGVSLAESSTEAPLPSTSCGTGCHGVAGSDDEEEEMFTDVDGLTRGLADSTAGPHSPARPQSGGHLAGNGGRRFLATGILQGIDEDGALLIRTADGSTQKFLGGHLVRP